MKKKEMRKKRHLKQELRKKSNTQGHLCTLLEVLPETVTTSDEELDSKVEEIGLSLILGDLRGETH